MSNLTDQERKAFEAYLQPTATDAERQEALVKLVPGSALHYYLYFLDRFRKVGGAVFTAEEEQMFVQFGKKYPHSTEYYQIKARYTFLKYDEQTSQADKERVLNEITWQYAGVNFDHYKPEGFHKQGGGSESVSEAEDNPSVAFGEQAKVYEFKYDTYFSKDIIKSRFHSTPTDEATSNTQINRIPPGFEHEIDFTALFHPRSVYHYFACAGKRITDLQNPSFYASLKAFFEEEYRINKHFELNQTLLDKLTLAQLDKLAGLHPKIREDKVYIGSYFQKQFSEELSKENQEIWSTEEKRANLLTLYNFAKTKEMPKSLQAALLLEILDLGIKVGDFNEPLFRDYLKFPLATGGQVFTQSRVKESNKTHEHAQHWNRYISNVQQSQKPQQSQSAPSSPSWTSTQSEVIKKYLEYFCTQKGGSLESFKEDFDKHYLRDIEERIAIYSVEAGEGLTKLINQGSEKQRDGQELLRKYREIESETIVRFLESNTELFKVEDEVFLSLELKNVQTLYLKIFEFNTETYYKKTLQPFNTGVNLDGLVASTERVVDDFKDRPSNKKYIETFKFAELTGRVGLFIVEFIGNGLSARAVIKKGSLSMIHKPTVAGHLAYVLDENRKICLGDEGEGRTGIQFDGQYYPARPDKGGKIFIPYGKSTTSAKAILMHNGFAQLCDFERQTEAYTFNAWMHLNSESILIGNKAQLLIKPQLQINNRLASLELLKNGKVTLTTTAYIDSIPVTKTFEGLKFANHRDCVLDFQVPPYLRDISVTLECEVFNITQQSNQKFTSQKTFSVQTQAHTFGMCEVFMKKEKGGDYYVSVLGKNGEPRADVSLQVTVMHKYFTPQSGYGGGSQVTLTTDKDGRIKLGQLKKVVAVTVNSSYLNVRANWFIGNQNGHEGYANMLTYPNQVDVVEGESLEFPLAATKKKSRKNISLIKLWSPSGASFAQGSSANFVVLDDLYEKIDFQKKEDVDYSVLKLSNLQEGVYKLKLKKLGKTILITVHRGQYWDSDSFILKRNCLFENRAPLKMIKIATVNIKPEETKQTYSIRVEDFTSTARLHVFASHFLPTMGTNMFLQLARMQAESGSSAKTVFPFAQWKNILMSNRELSDEFRYVFDRKYLGGQRPLGNTLERPKLLVKRHFLQNTTVDQEQLSGGSAYAQQHMYQEVQSQAIQQQRIQPMMYQQQQIQPQHYNMMNNVMPRSQMIQSKAYMECDDDYGGGYGGGNNVEDEMGYDGMMSKAGGLSGSESQVITEFQNFLKNPTFTLFNLTPNAQTGEVTFQADLKAYSQLYIVAIDLNSVSQRIIDLGNLEPTAKRDLSLASSLPISGTSGFTESRTTSTVTTDTVVTVDDITSTDLQLIDDLKKVRGVLEELMRTNGVGNQQGVFKELVGVVLKWGSMESDEDKCKTYYKNLCHELNIFLFLKDRLFFDKVVKQLIECKLEKTFIDLYLLGRFDELVKRFYGLEHLNKTNAFEKCLLVDALVQSGKKDEAKKVVEYIKLTKESSTYTNVEQDNRIFDIVLNLNMLKEGAAGSISLPSATVATSSLAYGGLVAVSGAPNDPFTAGRFQRFDSACSYDYEDNKDEVYRHDHAGARNHVAHRMRNLNRNASYGSECSEDSDADECEEMVYLEKKKPAAYNNRNFAGKKEKRRDSSRDIMREYASQKKKVRMAFEEIQTTGEYMETHYFKQRNFATSAALISVNAFWHDYAQYLLNRGEEGAAKHFLSANFTKNADNQVSAILTFALLDLPLTDAPSHQTKGNDGRGLELKAAGNIIIFRKEVREAPFEVTNDIIVTHRYIPSTEASENQSSAIPDEFLVNKAYSCEVIMTNVSPKQSTFSLLYQIPQGSLPLQQTKYMKSLQQTLSPYTTQKLIFHFYFPKSGEFTHFPSNVAAGEKIIARATGLEGRSLKVVRKLSVAKKETFLDIMQSDNREEDVIEFIKTHNLLKGEKGFSFHQMLWMLKDKDFFKKVLEVLRGRMIYDNQVWSYALHHKLVDDELALREYFQNAQPWNMVQYLGSSFSSKLFTRTLADAEFKALDYFPMVNARAHQVGDLEHWTLNRTFKDTYHSFLRIMVQHASAQRASSGVDDPVYKLLWVQYLQLQDRIDEAIKMFEEALPELLKMAESDGSVRIQVDYMRAYFDFFTGLDSGFKIARSIVRDYENYPVPQWRIPFLEILDQLNEYDGEMIEDDEVPDKDLESMTEEQKKQKYKQSIKKEPRLACELNEQKLEIEAANIKQVQVKFYIIDAEILFSRTPFLKTNTEEFSYVKPCHKLDLDLSTLANSGVEKSSLVDESVSSVGEVAIGQVQKVEVKIPEHLQLQNMVIEIGGEGKQLFKTYYATQIKVVMTEAYGELKVLEKGDSAKPLPRVYVKVFAQKKGQSTDSAFFFKDGYTDIRGKFDYAQTSGNRLKDVQKFAILVMSDTLGSIIKECDPPKGDFSGASAAESGVSGGADKAERIINRVNKWNAQKTSAKCK